MVVNDSARVAAPSRNLTHSFVLIAGIGLITALSAYVLWGRAGVAWTFALSFVLLLISPRITPEVIIRMYGAQRVDQRFGAPLLRGVEELARRAGLPSVPKIFIIPTPMLNAFATGTQSDSVIAVTQGMLKALSSREISAVLAHEMAHIRHNDLWVMNLADTLSRFTHLMSMMGVLLFLFNLPLLFMGGAPFPWLGIVLLYLAPTISSLLQLGLSRAREYEADHAGAQLSGDPEGLASALQKIEKYQGGMWERVFLPGRRVPVPSLLRTHPPTKERIRRLRQLHETPRQPVHVSQAQDVAAHYPTRQRPRYHLNGLWY